MEKVNGLNGFSALGHAGLVCYLASLCRAVGSGATDHHLQQTKLETTEAGWAFSSSWDHVGFICRSQRDRKAALSSLVPGKVSNDWEEANVIPVFTRGKKKDLSGPVS